MLSDWIGQTGSRIDFDRMLCELARASISFIRAVWASMNCCSRANSPGATGAAAH